MEKILVIDDDREFRSTVSMALQRHGYDVCGAGGGAAGLAAALAELPSLILSDVNMAGQNGFELLKELRAHPETSAIPVIMMTSEPRKADVRLSMEQGANDCLAKPFTMEVLLAAVRGRLQRQNDLQQSLAAPPAAEVVGTEEKVRRAIGDNGLVRHMSARGFRNILQVVVLAFVFALIQMIVLQRVCNTGMRAATVLNQEGLPNLNHLATLREQIVLFRLYSYERLFVRENIRAQQAKAAATAEKTIHAELGEITKLLDNPQGRQLTAALDTAFTDLAQEYARMQEMLDQDFAKSMKMLDEDLPPKIQRVNEAEEELERFGYQFSGAQTQASFDGFNDIKLKTLLFGVASLLMTLGLMLFVLLAARRTKGQLSVALDQINEQSRELHLQTTALEAAASGIVITDYAGKILWVNAAFTLLTGHTAAEAVGQNSRFLKSGRQRTEFYAELWNRITAGNVWHGELVNRRKDGSCYDEEMSITPVRGANGEVKNFIAIKQDVSERKRAAEAVRQSQQEFKDIFDNAPVGFHEIDAEGRLVRINNTELKMLGYSAGELLGQFIWKISAEEEVSRQAALAKLSGETPPNNFGRMFRRKDGSTVPVLISDRILKREDGSIIGIRSAVQDDTERKRAEKELADKRDLLQALMDNLPDLIYFKDTHSRFTRINRAHARHFGLQNPEDATGKSDADFFPSMEARQKLVDEQCLLATGNPILGLVEKSDTAGETRWVSSTKVPIYGADGKITGLVGISRDITASKQAELERQAMEAQLRQSQKLESIGQLAAGIAHEINTPTQYVGDNTRFVKDSFAGILKVLKSHEALLAAIKANAVTPEMVSRCEEIMKAGDLDYLSVQIPTAIEETLEGIERVSKIVRAMKDFSHPGNKERKSANLNKAIESTVTVARNEWKYVADLELKLEPDLPLAPCFLGEFNQCVLNLIVNAAHAIGDVIKKNPGSKGLITVQTRRDGDHVEVRVTDTGTGIPESVRSKIFVPFFTTKDVGKGTGQGLAMVYGCIVKQHGGTAAFETEVGKGTAFIIRLPLKPQAGSAAGQPPPETTTA